MNKWLKFGLFGIVVPAYLSVVAYYLYVSVSIKPLTSNIVINYKKQVLPTPTPTPILVQIPNVVLIDCTGPDGKHAQATQKDCDNLNSFWKPKVTPTQTSSNNSNNSNTQNPTPTISIPTTTIGTIQTPTPTTSSTPTIRVTYPNGGETFTEGDNITITWEATNGPFTTFGIQYTDCPSCANTIANAGGTANSINWKVSVGNTSQTKFKIRIISFPTNYSPNPIDDSDATFTVIQNPACDSGCP